VTNLPVRSRTACLAAAVAVAGAVSLVAQQPTFRSSVEVLLVDVTVVDRMNFPLRDLGPGDFTVTVDGKARTILSAQLLAHRAPGIDDVLRVEAGMPPSSTLQAERVGAGRDIIIAVDEDSLEAGDGQIARKAIGRFLDQLVPSDRAAIVTIPRLPLRVGLSSNRVDLFAALDRVSTGVVRTRGKYNIGLAEAFAIQKMDGVTTGTVVERECDVGRMTNQAALEACRVDVVMEARQSANIGHDRGQRAVDAMRRLAELVSSIPRPKTLIFVSGGFPTPVSSADFTYVAAALAAGQVNLYTVFLPRYNVETLQGIESPTRIEDEGLDRIGIENLTSAAGGTLLEITGDFEPAFDRVVREISASYLLAVEVSAADRDGRPHRVDVKVGRRDVQVRSRKQYVIGKPLPSAPARAESDSSPGLVPQPGGALDGGLGQLSHNRILTAARDLEGTGDVYLKVKASGPRSDAAASKEVLVDVSIDPISVSFSPLEGRRVARLGVAIFCGDSKDAVVGELWQEMNLALKEDSYQRYKQQGIPFSAKVPVKGDARRVKVVVYDYKSDLVGAMSAKVK
jgi:VWFA-related protein